MTSGPGSAQDAFAQIQVLLNSEFKMTKLLDTQISPQKVAKISQRGRKSDASRAVAQRLKPKSHNRTSTKNGDSHFTSEHSMNEISRRLILKRFCEADKENHSPAAHALSTQEQNNSEAYVWDDTPISSWPFLKKSGNIGEEGSCAGDGIEATSCGLMRLSHFR